jgi:DNA-binding NarL/FixJ family response regulator
MNHVISVLIADDQDLVREGLRMLLEAEPDITVAGEAGNGRQAITAARRLDPDVVLMDVRMPDMDGIEATAQLVRAGSRAKILMLTTFDLDKYVYQAMRAGASGFLLKDASRDQLATAVRTVSAGEALLAPPITRRLVEDFCRGPAPDGATAEAARLSQRELDVVRQVAKGLSNAEIAGQLYLSDATVKSHVARILAKLGLRDRVQVVVFAYENGIIRPGESSQTEDRKPQPGRRS